jgi:hypothetical protein
MKRKEKRGKRKEKSKELFVVRVSLSVKADGQINNVSQATP